MGNYIISDDVIKIVSYLETEKGIKSARKHIQQTIQSRTKFKTPLSDPSLVSRGIQDLESYLSKLDEIEKQLHAKNSNPVKLKETLDSTIKDIAQQQNDWIKEYQTAQNPDKYLHPPAQMKKAKPSPIPTEKYISKNPANYKQCPVDMDYSYNTIFEDIRKLRDNKDLFDGKSESLQNLERLDVILRNNLHNPSALSMIKVVIEELKHIGNAHRKSRLLNRIKNKRIVALSTQKWLTEIENDTNSSPLQKDLYKELKNKFPQVSDESLFKKPKVAPIADPILVIDTLETNLRFDKKYSSDEKNKIYKLIRIELGLSKDPDISKLEASLELNKIRLLENMQHKKNVLASVGRHSYLMENMFNGGKGTLWQKSESYHVARLSLAADEVFKYFHIGTENNGGFLSDARLAEYHTVINKVRTIIRDANNKLGLDYAKTVSKKGPVVKTDMLSQFLFWTDPTNVVFAKVGWIGGKYSLALAEKYAGKYVERKLIKTTIKGTGAFISATTATAAVDGLVKKSMGGEFLEGFGATWKIILESMIYSKGGIAGKLGQHDMSDLTKNSKPSDEDSNTR